MSSYSTLRLLELRAETLMPKDDTLPAFPKIDPDVKALWLDALFDPTRKQGMAGLHAADGAQCCLGILCELHAKRHSDVVVTEDSRAFYYDGHTALPDEKVLEWAGIDNTFKFRLSEVPALSHLVTYGDLEMRMIYLFSIMNDRAKLSFVSIGEFIEKYL